MTDDNKILGLRLADIAKQAGFFINGKNICASDYRNFMTINDQLTKFAQLLQQGEAVDGDDENKVTVDKRDLFCFVRSEIKDALTNDENFDAQAWLWSAATDKTVECLSKLYDGVTPPDTQQKLDKAREALQDICNKEVRKLRTAEAISQQALKETE